MTVAVALPPEVESTLGRLPGAASLLTLDYDGTIAPFHTDRMLALPRPDLIPILQELAGSTSTRLVFSSGRPIEELELLLHLDPMPELYGAHGWEHRLRDGRRRDIGLPSAEAALMLDEYERLLREGLDAHVEAKRTSLALHWRGLSPEDARRLEALVGERWRGIAQISGMTLRSFNGGLELRNPGRDKGVVARELLRSTPPGAVVAYLGDDDTDEDAFRGMQGNGLPLLVSDYNRPTAASATLRHEQVGPFLEAWLANARRVHG